MKKEGVVNFSSFFEGNNEKRKSFDKNEQKPLFKRIFEPKDVEEPKKVQESNKKAFDKNDFSKPLFDKIVESKEPPTKIVKTFSKDEFSKPLVAESGIEELFENEIVEEKSTDDEVVYPEVVDDIVEEPKVDPTFDPPVQPEEFVIEDEPTIKQVEEEEYLPSLDNENNFNKVKETEDKDYYTVYNDKFENFNCNVMVEGAKLVNTKARLILESDDWNLVFDGEIDDNGKCNIPIKRLNILQEGTVGKIRLEVIAENTIFSPWEDDFQVKTSKKVAVQVPKKKLPKAPSVQVKLNKK